ncbi:hypothetical protein J4E82_011535 [Alternaria postmessia]|uniref:uncharacterized protein n=1 Tax=Alternaria postmessia TaxID=1187938 RepID=UPI0022242EE1|nr:uncharacterized protein J4E82_011535 [Alternaria postmessia]KAI5364353.1 hypothetical protein J4E82_011535 [Alternaria postmessia]
MQGSREDDDWCDVSDEAIPKEDSKPAVDPQDIEGASDDKEVGKDTSMPTLFSTALPPCGLLPQLAYDNIVHRLRALWLSRSQNPSANLSVTSLCRVILADLKTEEDQPISQALNPWRRSSVFAYEVRWARYFVREAETMDKRPTMTEKQADKQDFMDRMYPIPKELKIVVANRKNQKQVLDLWKEWHHGKRGTVETEDPGLGVGGAREEEVGVDGVKKMDGGGEEGEAGSEGNEDVERTSEEIMEEAQK